ncbi:hypothetical protein BJ322DRAFT_1098237 [Thelephora terrestris]|uniref:Translocon-associated protein subunit alpha n=1 Tax=Thelephora terrestris TaxID=56493 RepID=A0A9P6LB19_9AGAM|nr:hypothetical protein BJ322DRAFT_1098237 [Thelephora terrestris]
MRLATFVSGFVFLVTLFTSTFAEESVVEPEPELKVTGSFPSDNPFGHVVNGERNIINLLIENHTKRGVTLLSVAGSFHHPETDRLIKNTTATKFGVSLSEGGEFPIQYPFYSQYPGDVKLKIWLEDKQYRVSAYESIVTVVEPEISLLDWKLWTTYFIVFGILGGGAYLTFLSYAPKPKRPRVAAPSEIGAAVPVAATSSGGYDEEWIPEHHLKKTKKSGAVTSDAETSGGEASGKEGPRRRKGRK